MAKKIVGIRRYSFDDAKTGNLIEGCHLHFQWEESKVEGICCGMVKISSKKLNGYVPQLGDCIDIFYDGAGVPMLCVKVFDDAAEEAF